MPKGYQGTFILFKPTQKEGQTRFWVTGQVRLRILSFIFWVCHSPMGFYATTFILWKHGVIQCSVLVLHFAQSNLIDTKLEHHESLLVFFFSLYASQNTKKWDRKIFILLHVYVVINLNDFGLAYNMVRENFFTFS